MRSNFLRPTLVVACFCLILAGTVWAQEADTSAPAHLPRGQGEFEMVLIHGLGGNDTIWDEVAPYLMGTFNVFRFELAGHGQTQPIKNPSIAAEVKRLEQFIADNGVEYPTIVGHGLGGMIALQYALAHPADVHRLIVMDAAPHQLISAAEKSHVADLLMTDYDRFVASRYLQMSDNAAVTDEVVDMALRTDSATFISLLLSSFDFDVTERLDTLSVPLLIIGSEYMFPDPDLSRKVLVDLGWDNTRSLTFKRIEHAGYYMMLDRPVYTASVLLAFGVTPDYEFQD
ncbi:alpha/beta hydrolase [bacterium]|nr:alpha/beta hydrolase [bacterium]